MAASGDAIHVNDIIPQFVDWYSRNEASREETVYDDLISFDRLSQLDRHDLIQFFYNFVAEGGRLQSGGHRQKTRFRDQFESNYDRYRTFMLQPFDPSFDVDAWLQELPQIRHFGRGIATIYLNRIDRNRYPILNNKTSDGLRLLGYDITGNLVQMYKQVREAQSEILHAYPELKNFFRVDAINQFLIGTDEGAALVATLSSGPRRVWFYAPGEKGRLWDEMFEHGIMAIGWDELGDLSTYDSQEEIIEGMKLRNPDTSNELWNVQCFLDASINDIVVAKAGRRKCLGVGVITGSYYYDENRTEYRHVKKVKWLINHELVFDHGMFRPDTFGRTLKWDEIRDRYIDDKIADASLFVDYSIRQQVRTWWLNANPNMWNPATARIGDKVRYTTHNERGNKRRIYQNFVDVKPGDVVLSYVSSPLKRIVAFYEVTRGLHGSEDGECIELVKTEHVTRPITFRRLQGVGELSKCEPLINNQGSLFKLTSDEYEIIRQLIDDEKEGVEPLRVNDPYSLEEMALETSIGSDKLRNWLQAIERKGQAVMYGPPGTGKTYIAERLARHLVAGGDGFVELVQFHPAYSYEEFIQGIRPESDDKGALQYSMTDGRFVEFCSLARARRGVCVLIIDEINRANISRVFGELMYLLEYRDKWIPLAGGSKFAIPENVRIIGTMNTADRSIALVDFALRRRFAFLELKPMYAVLRGFHAGDGACVEKLIPLLEEINNKIGDRNYWIGISFFLVPHLSDSIEEIWRMEIEPYLEEYFFSHRETADRYRWEVIRTRLEV